MVFGKAAMPFFCVGVQSFGSDGSHAAAVLDILENQSFDEHVDFRFEKLAIFKVAVTITQFEQFIFDESNEFARRENNIVGLTDHLVILVVFLDIVEKRVDELLGIIRSEQSRVVEKLLDKFGFVVIRHAVNVVVVRVERAAVYVSPRREFAHRNFADFLLFGQHFRESRAYQLARFDRRIIQISRFHIVPLARRNKFRSMLFYTIISTMFKFQQ